MNELKEVVMTEDGVKEAKPQRNNDVMTEDGVREDKLQTNRGVICSTEDCDQPGLKYCKQCEFLCQQCYDDHSKSRVTKSHQVIAASEAFTKSKVPPYPPCDRHTQLMDLYSLKCNQPMCSTCSNSIHDGHKRCGLDQQAEVHKTKLEQICEDTDGLLHVVKQVMATTTNQLKQAEEDIDDACKNVKSTFKIMHDKLHKEENKMLSDLQDVRQYVKKTGDITVDSQLTTVANLESLKSGQVKLKDKDSPYDYVTVTNAIEADVENNFNKELPSIMWISRILRGNTSGKHRVDFEKQVMTKVVKVTDSVASDKQVMEVGRITIHDKKSVQGMVVYHERVYVVDCQDIIVYCYAPDGSLSHKYEHDGEGLFAVQGMCLVMVGDAAMLVIGEYCRQALIWIKICDNDSMEHHRTQKLGFHPRGAYSDIRGGLMVYDTTGSIHCYRNKGSKLTVIKLPDNVVVSGVTYRGDVDQYVVSDWSNRQVVIMTKKGQEKTHYRRNIHGVKLGRPGSVITDPHRGVLIADSRNNQVLLLRKTGDVVKILDQHVRSPRILYLDTDHHRLYVSGEDQHKAHHVFVFNYAPYQNDKKLTLQINKLDMKVDI